MTFRSNYNASNAIRCLLRLLTSDELKPRAPFKFAGYERLKVGHKKIWLRRSVAASRPYHPLNKPVTKDTHSRYFAASPPVLDADVIVALVPRKAA